MIWQWFIWKECVLEVIIFSGFQPLLQFFLWRNSMTHLTSLHSEDSTTFLHPWSTKGQLRRQCHFRLHRWGMCFGTCHVTMWLSCRACVTSMCPVNEMDMFYLHICNLHCISFLNGTCTSLYVQYHLEMNEAWHDMTHELSEFWTIIILVRGHCFISLWLFSFQFHVLGSRPSVSIFIYIYHAATVSFMCQGHVLMTSQTCRPQAELGLVDFLLRNHAESFVS